MADTSQSNNGESSTPTARNINLRRPSPRAQNAATPQRAMPALCATEERTKNVLKKESRPEDVPYASCEPRAQPTIKVNGMTKKRENNTTPVKAIFWTDSGALSSER